MKILVTGADGMLAKAIRNTYHDFISEVFFCSRTALDITQIDKLLEYFTEQRFDIVINCAAYTNVEEAESNIEQAYAINVTGTRNLAIAANAIDAILIHISTDAVYDGKKNGIYEESDICMPLSIYSKTKYEGELEISKYHNSGIIIRTSWLYSLDKTNFVTAIINKAKTIGKFNVVCDQLGTPTYAYDLAVAILTIIRSNKIIPNNGIPVYHYSNEGAISWYDFAMNICKILDIKTSITPINSLEYLSKTTRPFQTIMSKEKIKSSFNIQIPYWLDSLEKCLSSYSHDAAQGIFI